LFRLKKNRVPRGVGAEFTFGFAAMLAWLLAAGSLQAQASVVVLRPAGTPEQPGLIQALRIQLADAAPVVDGGELAASSLPERIAEAGQRSRQAQARLAIWVEPAQPGQAGQGDPAAPWLLYLVGQRDGRVLVDVVQVPEGTAPDVERSLALKVREAHDALRAAEPQAALLASEPAAAAQAPRQPWGFRLALGPAAAALDGSAAGQWGLSLQLGTDLHLGGRGREPGRVSLHAAAQLRWFAAAEVGSAAGNVALDELDPGLWLAALYRGGRFGVGLSTGLLARRIHVLAEASGGERGEARELVWSVPIALELQLTLLAQLALRLAPGLEINLDPENFAIAGVPVIELGRIRPGLELSLVLTDR
jgi:hypothetical protein